MQPPLKKAKFGFNTQPPEGGWAESDCKRCVGLCFNTQPPEGGWQACVHGFFKVVVSTHSRPKAAGFVADLLF